MVVKVRLKRVGRKRKPSYRVVAVDSRVKRDGGVLQDLGFYNPVTKQSSLNLEKTDKFLADGAVLTEAAFNVYLAAWGETLNVKKTSQL